MPSISKTICEAHSVSLGRGDAVLLIHGVAASRHDWDYLAPELAQAGWRAHALDLLGHGQSPKPTDPKAYQFEAVYEHFSCWAEDLPLSPPKVLCGHSLGGTLAMLYALRRPDRVSDLILINPVYTPRQFSPWLQEVQRRSPWSAWLLHRAPAWLIRLTLALPLGETSRFSKHVRHQIASDYKGAAPLVMAIPATFPDLTPLLGQISARTLVIWGSKDRTLMPERFPDLVESLPNATGTPLPGRGHQPHLSDPDQVNRMVLEFLS